jgi:Fe-Mn family superoxide dismutase
MITRRHALTALATAGAALAATGRWATLAAQTPTPGPFTLPPLGYPLDAMEPYIDARTMEIHHDRHHKTYVDNLNRAVAGDPDLGKKNVEELVSNLSALPESIRTAVRNSGGGHANHTLFWQCMKKNGGGTPSGDLGPAMDKAFGSFDKFKEKFTDAALKQFGSGWAWLTLDPRTKQLAVESSPNQDTPLSVGHVPLLGIDVWEHAYYLKYQNKRADYIAAYYNVINWDFVASRFKQSQV